MVADFVYGQQRLTKALSGKSIKVQIPIASRAALRSVPFLWRVPHQMWKHPRIVALPLRAMAALSIANYAAGFSNSSPPRESFRQALVSCVAAAGKVADMGEAITSSMSFQPNISVVRVACLVAESVKTPGLISAVSWHSSEIVSDFSLNNHMEIESDLSDIAAGCNGPVLASLPLWRSQMPKRMAEDLASLKSGLLSRAEEHWDVWTDWYEARLHGDPGKEEEELARILEMKEEEWAAGPAVANKKIKDILARFRNPPVVETAAEESLTEAQLEMAPPLPLASEIPSPKPQGANPSQAPDGRFDLPPPPAPLDPAYVAAQRDELAFQAQHLSERFATSNQFVSHGPILKRAAEGLADSELPAHRLFARIRAVYALEKADTEARDSEDNRHMALPPEHSQLLKALVEELRDHVRQDERLAAVAAPRSVARAPENLAEAMAPAAEIVGLAQSEEVSTPAFAAVSHDILADATPDPLAPAPVPQTVQNELVTTAENAIELMARTVAANTDAMSKLADEFARSADAHEDMAEALEKQNAPVSAFSIYKKKLAERGADATVAAAGALLLSLSPAVQALIAANPALSAVGAVLAFLLWMVRPRKAQV